MATKTLAGYVAGATGANWLISSACKAQFDLMAAAAIKPATEGGCGATLAVVDGYVSRYEAIRQLVGVKGYQADTTLEASVKDLTKNGAITDEQWIQLESNFNQDSSGLGYVNIFKTSNHAYLGNGLLLSVGGTDSVGGNYGCKPSEDLRRTGDVIKITANNKGAMFGEVEATWLLQSGSQFGFYFLGPDAQTFAYNPSFKFGPKTLERITYHKSTNYFQVRAAENGQIPTRLDNIHTNWDNETFKTKSYENPAQGLAYYASWAAKFTTDEAWKNKIQAIINNQNHSSKERAQACAISWGQPWLFGMERIS